MNRRMRMRRLCFLHLHLFFWLTLGQRISCLLLVHRRLSFLVSTVRPHVGAATTLIAQFEASAICYAPAPSLFPVPTTRTTTTMMRMPLEL